MKMSGFSGNVVSAKRDVVCNPIAYILCISADIKRYSGGCKP